MARYVAVSFVQPYTAFVYDTKEEAMSVAMDLAQDALDYGEIGGEVLDLQPKMVCEEGKLGVFVGFDSGDRSLFVGKLPAPGFGDDKAWAFGTPLIDSNSSVIGVEMNEGMEKFLKE